MDKQPTDNKPLECAAETASESGATASQQHTQGPPPTVAGKYRPPGPPPKDEPGNAPPAGNGAQPQPELPQSQYALPPGHPHGPPMPPPGEGAQHPQHPQQQQQQQQQGGYGNLPPSGYYPGNAPPMVVQPPPPVQIPPETRRMMETSKTVKYHLDHCALEKCLDVLHETPPNSIDPEIVHQVLVKCMVIGNMGAACEVMAELMPEKKLKMPIQNFTNALGQISQRSMVSKVRQLMTYSEKVLHFGPDFSSPKNPAKHKWRSEYTSHFLRLLILEFLEEAAQCWEKLNTFSITWLEDQGLCATMLTPKPHRGANILLVSEKRGPNVSAAPSSVVKGDSVLVSAQSHKGDVKCPIEIEAEVVTIIPHLTVRLIGMPQTFKIDDMLPAQARWRVDKMANRVTFSRQLDGVKCLTGPRPEIQSKAKIASTADPVICEAILSAGCLPTAKDANQLTHAPKKKPAAKKEDIEGMCASAPPHLSPAVVQKLTRQVDHTDDLNVSQRNAIKAALSRRLTLIHGPPGTGKTHTAVSIVQAWLNAGCGPVLCTSDSNTAVDNLVSGLAHAGIDVLRIGRPESVRGDLNQYTLDAITTDMPRDTPDQKKEVYRIQKERLQRASAVCATCSGSGSDILDRMPFPAVLLDEASQATEPSCIVPIMHGASQVALVGDHRQLPPTIISREADNAGLGVSLFDRLVRAGVSAHLLDTQYRMHPALMLYPSQCFYNNTVKSGVPSAMRQPVSGFNWPVLGVPAAFVPVDNGQDQQDGTSQINQKEADKVAATVNQLLTSNIDLKPSNIGIITPYASQVRLLRKMLQQHRAGGDGDKESPEVGLEINSVDGFQGREKEVILVSAVRANKQGEVGFLSDIRRMNVTLTRAKRGLIVFGHTPTLRHDAICWKPWLMWCYERGLVTGHTATDPVASAALSKIDAENPVRGVCNAPPKLNAVEEDCWTCAPPCSSINELDEDICSGCGKSRPEPETAEDELEDKESKGSDWEGSGASDWEDEALPEDLNNFQGVLGPDDEDKPVNTNTYVEFDVVEPAPSFQEWREGDRELPNGQTAPEQQPAEQEPIPTVTPPTAMPAATDPAVAATPTEAPLAAAPAAAAPAAPVAAPAPPTAAPAQPQVSTVHYQQQLPPSQYSAPTQQYQQTAPPARAAHPAQPPLPAGPPPTAKADKVHVVQTANPAPGAYEAPGGRRGGGKGAKGSKGKGSGRGTAQRWGAPEPQQEEEPPRDRELRVKREGFRKDDQWRSRSSRGTEEEGEPQGVSYSYDSYPGRGGRDTRYDDRREERPVHRAPPQQQQQQYHHQPQQQQQQQQPQHQQQQQQQRYQQRQPEPDTASADSDEYGGWGAEPDVSEVAAGMPATTPATSSTATYSAGPRDADRSDRGGHSRRGGRYGGGGKGDSRPERTDRPERPKYEERDTQDRNNAGGGKKGGGGGGKKGNRSTGKGKGGGGKSRSNFGGGGGGGGFDEWARARSGN